MCVAATARRRRRQARKGYKHLPPLRRPIYRIRDPETQARRLRELIENERRMKQKAK